MASGKRKTTMAKLNRERKLRERRVEKQVKKDLRKRAAAADASRAAEDASPADEGSGAGSAE
jgi:hypothetical protein